MSLPGPADQIHSFHQPIASNGLYWTSPIPASGLHISPDGSFASLEINDYPVIDEPKFPKPGPAYEARVSLRATWHAVGPRLARSDPMGKYKVQFHKANARIHFTASVPSLGFTFTSDPLATSESVFAMMGHDRNGVFF
ncbi:MAG: hypothetical protein NVSMB52_05010 [Chloroflexota bacterium]